MWICSWTPRCAGGLAFLGFVLIGSLEAGLGADLSGTMLPAHNSYRARHGVPALTWSNALASGAQLWANACTPQGGGFAHSPQAFSNYGENLSWGTGQSPDQAVASWYAESGRYDYNNALTSFNGSRGEVRHFTQLVWRGTSQVGCGVWNCSGQNLYVCRYSPPGNFNAQNPGVLATNVPRPVGVDGGGSPAGGGGSANNFPGGGGSTSNAPRPNPGQAGGGEFSAFANDGRGRWGFSVFQAAQDVAQQSAVNGCGGSNVGCRVVYTTRDACVAYAESRQGGYWFGVSGGTSQQQVSQSSVHSCQSGSAPPNSCRGVLARCR